MLRVCAQPGRVIRRCGDPQAAQFVSPAVSRWNGWYLDIHLRGKDGTEGTFPDKQPFPNLPALEMSKDHQ